ncbi:MAG: hypothetical protein A3C93_06295 [Candidatus Lloydbacteria bacterium RIFCSPHIGHO2_02_FULL_54_17]|uniref:GGDEF domain-containing protein n=1 Tax=Candidatus Lloydbacteria bacterium RIFCSPHIGHO2_02_FULL_54_17 TaxID=1798664 RepID=A0A1G2DGA0_9BACT|nr:MAG: hypothetical protein A3C93_06295 [Candidatus Lloydbacteria bacterium RIFCSPHIGHO2_02_FULL_54_17]OGZ13539.1 MAG: hypothetical protein A2948_04960 [Candidatus Lloydbacteria bacterium RIFCSPLOWO2_01_FULL_54_18]
MLTSRRRTLLQRMENIVIRRLTFEVRRLKAKCRLLEQNQRSPHDPRTGALTSEYFSEVVGKLLHNRHRRASEKDDPIALVMVDLDLLKPVNDKYGHPAGDEVLRSFSEVAQKQLRENDLVARYGGDEFTVLLRGAPEAAVPGIIEKLRQKFENVVYTFHRGVRRSERLRPSFSFGVATWKGKGDSLSKMSARADREMYKEKKKRKSTR